MRLSKTMTTGLLGAALGLCLIAAAYFAGPLQAAEWQLWDALQRWDSRHEAPCPDLRFIVLDQRSLDAGEKEFGLSWPWPREAYAQALEFLHKAGARLVLLDFLFSEPSFYGPEDDDTLIKALRAQGHTYLSLLAKVQGPKQEVDTLLQTRKDLAPLLSDPKSFPGKMQRGASLPIAGILAAATGAGNVAFAPDADGVARRVQPFCNLRGRALPCLGVAPLVQGKGATPEMRMDRDWLVLGKRRLPLDGRGNLMLRYPGKWTNYPTSSLIDVIASNMALREHQAPAIDPALFKDKVVVIGSNAEGLLDLRKTPLDANTPGFFIHAATWAAVTYQRVYNTHGQGWIFWLSLLGLALWGGWLGTWSFSRASWAVSATGLAYGVAGLAWLHFEHGVVFLLSPIVAMAAAFGISTGLSYRREQKQKQFIQSAFSQVLSPLVLERLMDEPEKLKAGGEACEVTVYFSDLAGFTKLSEKLEPEALVSILNRYLHEMITTIVDEQQGYVDKFIGDAVMAFWGAPVPDPDQAFRACRAALRNQAKLRALQPELTALGLPVDLHMRIGIHTGRAVVGMMGSAKKLNYTVIGDDVNLASRLEGVNKVYGTSLMISQETYAALNGRMIARELDHIRVKGKQEATRVYEVVAEPGDLTPGQTALLEAYQAGLKAYRNRAFAEAKQWFTKALEIMPDDGPSRLYCRRCEQCLKKAPGARWKGITVLRSK